jgi:hypothetical protein
MPVTVIRRIFVRGHVVIREVRHPLLPGQTSERTLQFVTAVGAHSASLSRSPVRTEIQPSSIAESKLEVLCGDHFCREIRAKRSTWASACHWPSVTPALAARSMNAQAWPHFETPRISAGTALRTAIFVQATTVAIAEIRARETHVDSADAKTGGFSRWRRRVRSSRR